MILQLRSSAARCYDTYNIIDSGEANTALLLLLEQSRLVMVEMTQMIRLSFDLNDWLYDSC
jgi:hypothetical protein